MKLPKTAMIGAAATAMFAGHAFATDYSTEKQREQLLYQQQTQNQKSGTTEGNSADGAIGQTKPNSGPGVQGAPDTRTGPATRAPADGSDSSAGASSGEAGMEPQQDPSATTKPSQDSSGVQGFPDTRTGPATKGSSE
jgi:hypothetical protein